MTDGRRTRIGAAPLAGSSIVQQEQCSSIVQQEQCTSHQPKRHSKILAFFAGDRTAMPEQAAAPAGSCCAGAPASSESHAVEQSSGSGLFFSVAPVTGARLTLRLAEGESLSDKLYSSDGTSVMHYALAGPPEALVCLSEVLDGRADALDNVLSPPSFTTVSGAHADKMHIPEGAVSFTFSYAFASLHGKQQRLLEVAAARLGEEVLTERPAWLSFVLTGGYCYFDERDELLCVNALSLQPTSCTANITLVGPYAACAEAGTALREEGRLQAVAIPELRSAGFHLFGWVFKNEKPGGHVLDDDGNAQHEAAFVYAHEAGEFFYYQLTLPDLAPPRCKGTRPRHQRLLQLEQAMAAGVHQALTSAARAKETYKKLRKDDQDVMQRALQLTAPTLPADEHRSSSVARRRRHLRRLLFWVPTVGSLLASCGLVWLASAPGACGPAGGGHAGLTPFRVVASLVWFGLLALITWRILADCSTEGLTPADTRRLRRTLVAVPLLATGTELVALLAARTATAPHTLLVLAAVLPHAVACVAVFAALPSAIYWLRRERTRAAMLQLQARKMAAVGAFLHRGLGRDGARSASEANDASAPASSSETRHHEAARRIQTRFRRQLSRRRLQQSALLRRQRLLVVSKPILAATLVFVAGDVLLAPLDAPPWLRRAAWLLLLLPAVAATFWNRRGDEAARARKGLAFSLTHGVFFAAFHVHLSLTLPPAAMWLWSAVATGVGDERWALLLASLGYFSVFVPLHLFAQKALALACIDHFYPHLLFPIHFFDFSLYYLFFAVRSYTRFDAFWLPGVLLLQGNIFLKNTGTWQALIMSLRRRLGLKDDLSDDPLINLQFLARLAVLYDLADVSAMLTVPTMISLFAWRDGSYTVDGMGLVLRRCDLGQIWLHFALLLVVKQPTLWLVRKTMERKMAWAISGRSMHGKSSIALAIQLAEGKLAEAKGRLKAGRLRPGSPARSQSGRVAPRESSPGEASPKRPSRSNTRTPSNAQLTHILISHVAKVADQFEGNRTEVLKREWDFLNLRYKTLWYKTLRRSWSFFAAVVLFELFAVLPRHGSAPLHAMTCIEQHAGAAGGDAAIVVPPWAAWVMLVDGDGRNSSAVC